MADILEEIVAHKKNRDRAAQALYPATPDDNPHRAENAGRRGKVPGGSMRKALMNSETGIIAEFKRKSPSPRAGSRKRVRRALFRLRYQQNGASALSILTDIDYFRRI